MYQQDLQSKHAAQFYVNGDKWAEERNRSFEAGQVQARPGVDGVSIKGPVISG